MDKIVKMFNSAAMVVMKEWPVEVEKSVNKDLKGVSMRIEFSPKLDQLIHRENRGINEELAKAKNSELEVVSEEKTKQSEVVSEEKVKPSEVEVVAEEKVKVEAKKKKKSGGFKEFANTVNTYGAFGELAVNVGNVVWDGFAKGWPGTVVRVVQRGIDGNQRVEKELRDVSRKLDLLLDEKGMFLPPLPEDSKKNGGTKTNGNGDGKNGNGDNGNGTTGLDSPTDLV